MTFASAALGIIIGLIQALSGAGGGILAVPLLLFVLHLNVAEAAPVALLAVGSSAAVGAAIGLRKGVVRYRAAALMAGAGIFCSPLGLWLAHRLPNAPLMLLFAAVLAFFAFRMHRQIGQAQVAPGSSLPMQPCQLDPDSGRFVWTASCVRALVALGISAGFLSGLLGVGGGFVVVPALRQATNASMQSIVATSLAVIALVSASGVASSAATGHMNWHTGIPFTAGAVAGMLIGWTVARRLSGPRLQQGFAIVAALVAIGMVARVIWL